MDYEAIRARIKELEDLAMKAYKSRDYAAEDAYDREAAELRKKLLEYHEEAHSEEPLSVLDLIPHTWRYDNIRKYGDDRCLRCGMKYSYYLEGLTSIDSWPEADKHTKEFNDVIVRYSCVTRRQ
jgi:hypothetical protein